MKRRLVISLSALSLMLCTATSVLWWNSYRPNPTKIELVGERRYSLVASRGILFVEQWTATRWKSPRDIMILGGGGIPDTPSQVEVTAESGNPRWQFRHGVANGWFKCREFCGFGWSSQTSPEVVFDGRWRKSSGYFADEFSRFRIGFSSFCCWSCPSGNSAAGREFACARVRSNAPFVATTSAPRPTDAPNAERSPQRRWRPSSP